MANQHLTLLQKLSESCGTDVCSADFIRANARALEKSPGIYFLLKGKEIVYIGQSVDPDSRVPTHQNGEYAKDFDSYFIYRCQKSELDALVFLFILHYQPRLNSRPSSKQKLLDSVGTVRKKLKALGQSIYPFKRWRKQGLIRPIGEFDSTTYFWASDVDALISTKFKEGA